MWNPPPESGSYPGLRTQILKINENEQIENCETLAMQGGIFRQLDLIESAATRAAGSINFLHFNYHPFAQIGLALCGLLLFLIRQIFSGTNVRTSSVEKDNSFSSNSLFLSSFRDVTHSMIRFRSRISRSLASQINVGMSRCAIQLRAIAGSCKQPLAPHTSPSDLGFAPNIPSGLL